MSDLSSSVSVSFSPNGQTVEGGSGAQSGGLSLSRINVTVGPDGVAAKLVDRVQTGTLMLFATEGTVSIVGDYTETIPKKLEPILAAEFIDTPFSESISFILAIDEAGNQFVPSLTPINGGKRQKLNKKAWGLIERGSYTQPWKLLKYKPDLGSSGDVLVISYGSIAAYKAQNIATLEMEPLPTEDKDDQEVYRITSRMVVNEEGEWEYPPNWPNDSTYALPASEEPEPGTGVVPLRVHEICTINQNGYVSVRRNPIKIARPFIGNNTYQPVKTLVKGPTVDDLTFPYQSRAAQVFSAREGQPL